MVAFTIHHATWLCLCLCIALPYVHWLTFVFAVALAPYHPVTFQYIPSRYIALHGRVTGSLSIDSLMSDGWIDWQIKRHHVNIGFHHHIPSLFCSKHIQHLPGLIIRNGCIAWGCLSGWKSSPFCRQPARLLRQEEPGVEITTIHYPRMVSVNKFSALIW